MGELTTHLLDLTRGRPAAGVQIDVYRVTDRALEYICSRTTGEDGRLTTPLLKGVDMRAGVYELAVRLGDYFRADDARRERALLFDVVTVRFVIERPEENFHIPLLVTPWSYQVYRGS